MDKKTGKGIAFGIGGAVSVLFGAIIAWGQLKPYVEQSQVAAWPGSECKREVGWPSVCVAEGVSRADVAWVYDEARHLGYRWPEAQWRTSCPAGRKGWITVRIDPSMDDAGAQVAADGTLSSDGIEFTDIATGPSAWELGHQVLDRAMTDKTGRLALVSSDIRLHPNAGRVALGHAMLVHAMGFQHPSPGAPAGNLANSDPERAGEDTRGLECVSWR